MSCKFVAYLHRKVKKVAAKQILLLPTNIPCLAALSNRFLDWTDISPYTAFYILP